MVKALLNSKFRNFRKFLTDSTVAKGEETWILFLSFLLQVFFPPIRRLCKLYPIADQDGRNIVHLSDVWIFKRFSDTISGRRSCLVISSWSATGTKSVIMGVEQNILKGFCLYSTRLFGELSVLCVSLVKRSPVSQMAGSGHFVETGIHLKFELPSFLPKDNVSDFLHSPLKHFSWLLLENKIYAPPDDPCCSWLAATL